MIGHCVYKHLFSSSLLFDFVYAMMILMSEHTHNIHTGGGGGGRGVITKIR